MFDLKTKILIVDDMSTMRKIVGKILKDLGFSDITEAADGLLAWEVVNASQSPFGLIISDWNMPNCTGLDFLKRVRADQRHKKTPFVLVTAEAEQEHVVAAVTAGVDQYVVKPFSKDQLQTKLESLHKKLAQ